MIRVHTRGGRYRPKRRRHRRRPERGGTRRHRIHGLVDPRGNDGTIRDGREKIGALINLINRCRNRGDVGRSTDIQRIRRGRPCANGARGERGDLKERRLEGARRGAADVEGADGDRGSDERRIVNRAQRENVGPGEGIVGARGQHVIRGNKGWKRHEAIRSAHFMIWGARGCSGMLEAILHR